MRFTDQEHAQLVTVAKAIDWTAQHAELSESLDWTELTTDLTSWKRLPLTVRKSATCTATFGSSAIFNSTARLRTQHSSCVRVKMRAIFSRRYRVNCRQSSIGTMQLGLERQLMSS